jgi:hypothetical protein
MCTQSSYQDELDEDMRCATHNEKMDRNIGVEKRDVELVEECYGSGANTWPFLSCILLTHKVLVCSYSSSMAH